MTAMRVTHILSSGAPAVELAPGIFKVRAKVGALLVSSMSLGARGVTITATDSADTIDVTEADTARVAEIVAARERRTRLEAELLAERLRIEPRA